MDKWTVTDSAEILLIKAKKQLLFFRTPGQGDFVLFCKHAFIRMKIE